MRMLPDWMTVRIFLAALEAGSITRAAERCGIATAAAAKRMQVLEAEAGVPLLERTARGVRATAAGEAFARHARALQDLGARLAADLHAFAVGGLGSVRLHATASALAGHELAGLLAGFAKDQPDIQVELRENTSLMILQDLLDGRADLGIITTEAGIPPGLEQHPWREDRLTAVVGEGHPLAARASVGFVEVLDHPLIGPQESSAISLLLEQEANRLGRALHYRFRVLNTDAARRLAAAGHGLTVMPDGVIRPYEASLGLRGIPLADPWAQRRLRVITRPAGVLPPPAHLLLQHLVPPVAVPGRQEAGRASANGRRPVRQ